MIQSINFHVRLFAFVMCVHFCVTMVSGATEFVPETIIKPKANRGMVIDAGSGGSRLHVFRWEPRIFKTLPPEISYPSQDEKWTSRMSPGIADLAGHPDLITSHLVNLLNFAKSTLSGSEDSFKDYPIFFKATGGMRQIALGPREDVMTVVRSVLSNKTLCPFYFHYDMARVISGEEEAIYSWAAVNFLMGTLLPASKGTGTAFGGNTTYGTLDLGGASTQIAFFIPSQDISEGLFKFQIGGQKHWNVYTKSFLQFGHVSARQRHVSGLAEEAASQSDLSPAVVPQALDYCFFSGYSENVYPTSTANKDTRVLISGPPVPAQDQFDRCLEQVRPLLVKYNNDYCNVVYSGQCSINGAYQPSVSDVKHFIGTSSYRYPWKILLLPDTAPLSHFRKRAEFVCSMSFSQVIHYYEVNNFDSIDDKLGEMIPNYCFLASYTYALLTEGYGFRPEQSITVLDQLRGNKVSWALGAILYEINTMPWELDLSYYGKRMFFLWIGPALLLLAACVVLYYRHSVVRVLYEKVYLATDHGRGLDTGVTSVHSYQSFEQPPLGVFDPSVSHQVRPYQAYQADKYNSNISQASTVEWNETDGLLTVANLASQPSRNRRFTHGSADDSSSNDSSPLRSKFMFRGYRPKKSSANRTSGGPPLPTILSNSSTLVSAGGAEAEETKPITLYEMSLQCDKAYGLNQKSLSVSPATTVATTDSLMHQGVGLQTHGIEVE